MVSQVNNNKISILVAGATEQLGSAFTRYALQNPNLLVNILIRDPKKNPELVSQVEAAGGKVFQGDVTDTNSLNTATKGIHTVVSLINSSDPTIAADGQIALIKASIANGVQRFVPSADFGVNYTNFSREELLASPITAPKVLVEDFLKTVSIPVLSLYAGGITETFFYIHSQGLSYWGDENVKHDLTSYDNTARFAVAAVANKDLTGRQVYVGGSYTIQEVANIYNKVRGTNVQPKRNGSIDDLRNLVAEKKKSGDAASGGFLALLVILNQQGSHFDKTDNARFTEVPTESLEEFLNAHPEIKIA